MHVLIMPLTGRFSIPKCSSCHIVIFLLLYFSVPEVVLAIVYTLIKIFCLEKRKINKGTDTSHSTIIPLLKKQCLMLQRHYEHLCIHNSKLCVVSAITK